jgi:hypothetical protein
MLLAEIGPSRLSCGQCRLRSNARPARAHRRGRPFYSCSLPAWAPYRLARRCIDAGWFVVRSYGDETAATFHRPPAVPRKPISHRWAPGAVPAVGTKRSSNQWFRHGRLAGGSGSRVEERAGSPLARHTPLEPPERSPRYHSGTCRSHRRTGVYEVGRPGGVFGRRRPPNH